MKAVSKITTKEIVGAPKEIVAAYEGVLYSIFGIVHRAEKKTTPYGDCLCFHGNFKAVDSKGEVFVSGKAYVPTIVSDALEANLAQSEGKPVEFAVAIGKKNIIKKDGTDGYEYTVVPLIQPSENNPLDLLMERAQEAQKQLSAPKVKK